MHFKLKKLMCSVLISATLITPLTLQAADANEFITANRVNLRSQASTEAEIYNTLNYGTEVNVLEYDENGWSKVNHSGTEGYIKSEFLLKKSEYNPETDERASDVELLPWSEARNVFTTYTPAKVYDVRSGLVYYVQSFSNGKHADVETLTQEDTNILLQTYGGRWQWDPRPVFVTINGRTMAASINGMPHGGGTISGNGMQGQVCIHFQGSTTHNGNQAFTNDHQNAVIEAWNAR